jgi:hypothetical protein
MFTLEESALLARLLRVVGWTAVLSGLVTASYCAAHHPGILHLHLHHPAPAHAAVAG